ncbi:MAG TPA: hypothetical protein VM657_10190 [Sphingomonas sp.]|nr:hypothetical protein [Sphingomonas sp.]
MLEYFREIDQFNGVSGVGGAILKRISARQKIKILQLNARKWRRENRRPPAAINSGRTAAAKAAFATVRAKLPSVANDTDDKEGRFIITPPKVFSLSKNYDQTLAFILDFKRLFYERKKHLCEDGIRRTAYADFSIIEHIGAGAGLALAAEVHRFSQYRGKPPRIYEHLWSESVRKYFIETGLFELLHIDPSLVSTRPSSELDRSTLKFTSGRITKGGDVKELITRLQSLAGRSLDHRPAVYAAIAEALANVSHAYPSWFRSWPYRSSRQWWVSGFWRPSGNTVGLQLYDQGAGIPATLPRQAYWPRLVGLGALDPERTAAGLIAAALQYGRTSTGQAGRGKGLAEMANWIETTGSGFLRILSAGGEVVYRPGGKLERRNFNAPFCGTLVEWEVSVGN